MLSEGRLTRILSQSMVIPHSSECLLHGKRQQVTSPSRETTCYEPFEREREHPLPIHGQNPRRCSHLDRITATIRSHSSECLLHGERQQVTIWRSGRIPLLHQSFAWRDTTGYEPLTRESARERRDQSPLLLPYQTCPLLAS